jgi:hypothetical protein
MNGHLEEHWGYSNPTIHSCSMDGVHFIFLRYGALRRITPYAIEHFLAGESDDAEIYYNDTFG